MSRLRAWTWKEAREHRWALLGVWLAVALVTALPFVAFGEETTRAHLDRLPALSIALATLVLGLDLFARETRRSTHALILRTPRAMRWAFPAKLLLFAFGTLAALAIEELLRHTLEAATGIPRPYRLALFEGEWRRFDRAVWPEIEFGLPVAVFAALLAAAVGLWHVAGSVVSPRAGVGALCGVMALGALCVPSMLLQAQHPWWFYPSAPETCAWIVGIGLAGLLVAGVAWYSGRRHLLPRRTAALRGGVAALVLAGLATGAMAYAIDRWEAADPRAPEFRIESGFLGAGGTRLYLTTSRGSMYGDFSRAGRQTPPMAWTVKLDDPTGRASDVRSGSWFTAAPGIARIRSLVPLPFVVRVDQELPRADAYTDRWTFLDTRTDQTVFGGGWRSLDARTIEASRATAKAQTPLRDSKGRRVWWVEGAMERDGDEDRVPMPAPSAKRGDEVATIMTSGVLVEGNVRDPARSDGRMTWRRVTLDAETGASAPLRAFDPPPPPDFTEKAEGAGAGSTVIPLGATQVLARWRAEPRAGALDSGWLLWDADVPSRYVPPPDAPSGWDVEGAGEATLLLREELGTAQPDGEVARTRLVLWRPLTGERFPVACPDASLLSPGRIDSVGVLPDGRRLILLYERTGLPAHGRQALVLLDATTRSIAPVAPWSDESWTPIAFDVDGSLLVIEDARRVVRLSDGGAKREVVWPK